MTDPGNCANCGEPLPPGQPGDNRYCVKCTARYWRGAAARKQLAPPEDDAPQDVSGNCANCGEPLPPGQSAVNSYCAKCAAAWQRGPTAQK